MITPTFYVGQKVVCTDDSFVLLLAQDPRILVPVKDQQYTVRKNYQFLHNVGILLEELDNSHAVPAGRKLEPNFRQSRFRSVVEAPAEVLEEQLATSEWAVV